MSMDLGSGGTYVLDGSVTTAKIAGGAVTSEALDGNSRTHSLTWLNNTGDGMVESVAGGAAITEQNTGVVSLITSGASQDCVYTTPEGAISAAGVTITSECDFKVGTTAASGASDFLLPVMITDAVVSRYAGILIAGNTLTSGCLQTYNGAATDSAAFVVDTTAWHTYKVVLTGGSDAKLYIDGVLKATNTTNLPTTDRLTGGSRIFCVAGGHAMNYSVKNHKIAVIRA